jgi:7,8-dihydropterin-6-yl-methyl-4-(beta-D-ribofuranosyl)aminobenzene 5'-phosphate synthase
MKRLSGRCICCAAHGLSCLITAYRGESKHTILFDTGPEEEVFVRNVSRLGVDLGTVEGIILSHGHWDAAVEWTIGIKSFSPLHGTSATI